MVSGGTHIGLFGKDLEAAEREWTVEERLARCPPEVGILFRVEAVSCAAISHYACPVSGEGEWYTTPPRLELFGYDVHKWTEHGATLNHCWSGARRRWVDLRPGAKQWASRTAREAVEQFALRRKRQLYVLKRQIARAEEELSLTDHILGDGQRGRPHAPVAA